MGPSHKNSYYSCHYINGRFVSCQGYCCVHTSFVVKAQQNAAAFSESQGHH